MPRLMLVLVALLAVVTFAADTPATPPPQPKSAAAVAAIQAAQKKIDAAETTFRAAKKRAIEDEIDALNVAKTVAMRNGNLDEANAIAAKVTEEKSETADDGNSSAQSYEVYHQADGRGYIWFFADGSAIESRGMRIVWLKTGQNLLMLYADGGTKKLHISADKNKLAGGPDVFTRVDPSSAPKPPTPKD